MRHGLHELSVQERIKKKVNIVKNGWRNLGDEDIDSALPVCRSRDRVTELLSRWQEHDWGRIFVGNGASRVSQENLHQYVEQIQKVFIVHDQGNGGETARIIQSTLSFLPTQSNRSFAADQRSGQLKHIAYTGTIINQLIWAVPWLASGIQAETNKLFFTYSQDGQQIVEEDGLRQQKRGQFLNKQTQLFKDQQELFIGINRMFAHRCVLWVNSPQFSISSRQKPKKDTKPVVKLQNLAGEKRKIQNLGPSWHPDLSFALQRENSIMFYLAQKLLPFYPMVVGSFPFEAATNAGLFQCAFSAVGNRCEVIPLPSSGQRDGEEIVWPEGDGIVVTRMSKEKLFVNMWTTPPNEQPFAHPFMCPKDGMLIEAPLFVSRIFGCLQECRMLKKQDWDDEREEELFGSTDHETIYSFDMDRAAFNTTGPPVYWVMQSVEDYKIQQNDVAIAYRDEKSGEIKVAMLATEYFCMMWKAMFFAQHIEKHDEKFEFSVLDQHFYIPNCVLVQKIQETVLPKYKSLKLNMLLNMLLDEKLNKRIWETPSFVEEPPASKPSSTPVEEPPAAKPMLDKRCKGSGLRAFQNITHKEIFDLLESQKIICTNKYVSKGHIHYTFSDGSHMTLPQGLKDGDIRKELYKRQLLRIFHSIISEVVKEEWGIDIS